MVPELVNHNKTTTDDNERTAFHSSSSSSSSVNATSSTSMDRRLRNHNRRHPLSSFGILVTAFVLIAAVVSTVTNYMGIVFNNYHGDGDSDTGIFIFTGNNNNNNHNHNNSVVAIDTDANTDTITNTDADKIIDIDFGDTDIDISVVGVGVDVGGSVGVSVGVGVGGVNHCCYGQNDWKDISIDAEYCKRNKGNNKDKDNSCVGKHSSKPCGTTTISATCCLQSNFNNHVYKANKCIKRVCYPTCSSS